MFVRFMKLLCSFSTPLFLSSSFDTGLVVRLFCTSMRPLERQAVCVRSVRVCVSCRYLATVSRTWDPNACIASG